jgi:malate permease and related proteins
VIAIALVILASVAVGAGAERRWGEAARRAGRRSLDILIYGLMPVVTFFTVSHVEITTGVGAGLAFGFAERGVATVLAYLIGTRLLRLGRPSVGAMMVCAGIANTGYLGVPLARTLFDGHQAVGQAITYDVVVSATFLLLVGFAIGAGFGTQAGETPRERVRAFALRNPPLLAFLLALVAPSAWSPDWAHDAAGVAVLAFAPLGFFALGVNLMQEQEHGVRVFPPPLTTAVGVTLGLRLLVAPAVMALLSLTVVKVPAPFLLQAGMASGINSLAVAHIYGLDLRITAATIAWSTTIVLIAAGVVAAFGGL